MPSAYFLHRQLPSEDTSRLKWHLIGDLFDVLQPAKQMGDSTQQLVKQKSKLSNKSIIHNNISSSEKVTLLLPSHIKTHQHIGLGLL